MPVAMLSSSLITEPKRYGRFNALDTPDPFALGPGMVLIKPTSISNSGGTATLGTNGQVTFSGALTVSLNGIFTSDFDNYMLSFYGKWDGGSGGIYLFGQMRSGGVDATGSNYTRQELRAESSTVSASRSTGTSALLGGLNYDVRSAASIFIYGPALAQPTAFRVADVSSGATLIDHASTHSLSTSYDGITLGLFFNTTGSTGSVSVYGIRS